MTSEITTIHFNGLLGFGANCYLIRTDTGYILIDTAYSPKRADLDKKLESAGCKPGNLRLIILTHGHGDHTGNCAYLRRKFATQIAMHRGDSEIVERKEAGGPLLERIILKLISFAAGLGETEPFKPDIYLEEGGDLSAYGWEAQVLHLPGHSNGSIGILTADGDLFCGDVFVNATKPAMHSIVTDAQAFHTSVERLKSLNITKVYPGHGKPFLMEQFIKNSQ